MNKKILLFLILLKSNLFADNEILSFVCIQRLNTNPGEDASPLYVESLGNTLKDLNKELKTTALTPEKIKKDYLAEYLDLGIYRIEYGTDLATRSELRKNYATFMDTVNKLAENKKDETKKQEFEDLKDLTYSYQILTRGRVSVAENAPKIPFWQETTAEALAQLTNAKPLIYEKTLELLQFSGGHGNFYRGLPTSLGGMQLTDFINLCIIMNNEIRKKVCNPLDGMLNNFKKNCSVINATADEGWQQTRLSYISDIQDKEITTEGNFKTLGGIPKKTFEIIRSKLDKFSYQDISDNFKLTTKMIYLNSAWSAGVMPILDPMLKDRGLMIGVISSPNDNDSSTDITDKMYGKANIQGNDIIKAFFEWYTKSAMITTNMNNGFMHYIFLKKIDGQLVAHYFLNPNLNDFVIGFDKREEAKSENILSLEKFPGLQNFNSKYNKDGNNLVERVYIWWCSWHTPITDEVIQQATDEALKVKALITYFQTNNISMRAHSSFAEFKATALNLFELYALKQIKI